MEQKQKPPCQKISFLHRMASAPLALLLFANTALGSTTLPPRRPGLWETTMHISMNMVINGQTMNDPGTTPTITAMCSSAATDAAEMKSMTGGMGHCASFDLEKSGSDYVMSGVCADPMGGANATITFKATITPLGDTALHMVSSSSGPGMSSNMIGDSKWLGACPAGSVPGDFGTIDNGQFVKHGNSLAP